MHRLAPLSALLALAAAAPAARADIVHLKNGRTIEGKTTRTAAGLKIERRLGSVVIPFARIASIEAKETPDEVFLRRRKALPKGGALARVALGQFALGHRWPKRARRLALEALVFDPAAAGLDALLTEIGRAHV